MDSLQKLDIKLLEGTSLFGHSLSSSIYKTESMIQFIPVPLLKFGIG